MRHDQARRPSVYSLERLVAELVGDECLALRHFLEGNVRRVAAVAVRHHVLAGRVDLDGLEQRIDADAQPLHVELGPFGHATDVDGVRLRGELLKVSPTPGHGFAYQAVHGEGPFVERRVGRWPRGENGPIRDEVLSWWEAVLDLRRPATSKKPARNQTSHRSTLLSLRCLRPVVSSSF